MQISTKFVIFAFEKNRLSTIIGVFPEDTRDSRGRITFHSINPYAILAGDPALGNFYTYSRGNLTFGYRHVCWLNNSNHVVTRCILNSESAQLLLFWSSIGIGIIVV